MTLARKQAASPSSSSKADATAATPAASLPSASSVDPCSNDKLSTSELSEAFQRLYCEVAVHWAKFYTEILKTARERHSAIATAEQEQEEDEKTNNSKKGASGKATEQGKEKPKVDESLYSKPWNRKWASRATAAAGVKDEEENDDPFSTNPMPKWSASTTAGAGADAEEGKEDDDKNMDDQQDSVLLSGMIVAENAAASPSGAGTDGVYAAGPFAAFLLREAGKVSGKDYSSYGPLSISISSTSTASTTFSSPLLSCPGLCLSGLKHIPLPSTITSFEQGARDVFRAINTACTRALSTLVLEGYVSDHVEVTQLLSRAYKYLSYFENDVRRCAAMHQRRVDMLSPLIEQLNPSIYLHLHKELSVEAGSAAQEVFELKQGLISAGDFGGKAGMSGPDFAAQLKKMLTGASDAADKAIHFYAHFLRCYADPRLKDAPIDGDNKPLPALQGASPMLDDPSVDAYLQTHFAVGRILSKRTPLAVPGKVTAHEAQIKALKAAAERFLWLVKTAESGIKPKASLSPAVQSEVSIAKEMAGLLPEKINLMTRQYQAAMSGVAGGGVGGASGSSAMMAKKK
jgi:KIF-1 binding protein C terminal